MVSTSGICFGLAILLIINFCGSDAGRIARSPQFSQAQASAQAGGGFNRPNFGPPGPGGPGFRRPVFVGPGQGTFGYRPRYTPGFGGLGNGGLGGGLGNGGTISISKSISISRGGVATSNAGSSASGK